MHSSVTMEKCARCKGGGLVLVTRHCPVCSPSFAFDGSVPRWAIQAAERITSNTKHDGAIDHYSPDAIGQWRWQQRTTRDVARIIAEEAHGANVFSA